MSIRNSTPVFRTMFALALPLLAAHPAHAGDACWFLSYAYNGPSASTSSGNNSGLAALEIQRHGDDSGTPPTWPEILQIAKMKAVQTDLIGQDGVVTPLNLVKISCVPANQQTDNNDSN